MTRFTQRLLDKEVFEIAKSREIARTVHANKSNALVRGQQKRFKKLSSEEEKIERQREAGVALSRVKIPKSFYKYIEREKIERFDRPWEFALILEAIKAGWSFWSFEADVKLTEVEKLDHQLHVKLTKIGVILFVESRSKKASSSFWPGRWVLAVKSGFDPLAIKVKSNNRNVKNIFWRLLFSPQKR